MKQTYLVAQEPKWKWRQSHVIVIVPVLAHSKADALRQFNEHHAAPDAYFKAPTAHLLVNGAQYCF